MMRYQVRQQFRDLLDAICFNIHTDNEFSENSPYQTHLFPEFANYVFTSPQIQINKNLQVIKSSLIFKNKKTIPSTINIIHKIIGIFEEIKLSFLTKHKNNKTSKQLDTTELATHLPSYLTILNLAADIKFSEKSYNLALDYTRLIDAQCLKTEKNPLNRKKSGFSERKLSETCSNRLKTCFNWWKKL